MIGCHYKRAVASHYLGDFNSGPVYQPEGYKLLVNNKYQPLFSQPTYCPAATHSTFGPCVEAGDGAAPASVQKAIDNIFVLQNGGACLKGTFAEQPVSDHIGLAALCVLRKQ